MQIQPIPHPLTGLFEGIQRGISLGLTLNELRQRQAEKEELLNLEKQKLQALTEYRQKEDDMKMLNYGLGMLKDKNISKGTKLNIYNSVVVPAGKSLGFPLEVMNDWVDGMDEYVKRASDIYRNKDYSWSQKKDLITLIMLEAGDDENFKPVMQSINERLKQEEQQAEQKAYNLHYKALRGEITDDEIDELKKLLDQYPAAYGRAREVAINNRRNELLSLKTQKEIETSKQKYEIYYNPNTGSTMHVNILDRNEVERARRQGYLPWVGGAFKTKETEEEKYTLPQKLDDLRAEYNRMVDALDRKYGLKGGGLIAKTLLDLDEGQKARYLEELNNINTLYNNEYKKLTKRNAPFLVTPEEVESEVKGKEPPLTLVPSHPPSPEEVESEVKGKEPPLTLVPSHPPSKKRPSLSLEEIFRGFRGK